MNQAASEMSLEATAEPAMRILMAGSCPSLSGLSEISFFVGVPVGSQDVSDTCFRIAGNSSSGKYNGKWVSIATIERCLAKIPPEQTFSVSALKPIYLNGSANSHGFLGSILLHYQVIARAPEGQSYVRHTATAFWEKVKGLIGSGVDLKSASMAQDEAHIVVPVFKTTKAGKKAGRPIGSGTNA